MTTAAATIAALVTLLACAPSAAKSEPARPTRAPAASPAATADTKADLDWTGELQALKVANIEGDVKVVRASGKQARVRAFKSGPDAADVRLELDEKDGRVFVRPKYPERRNTDASVAYTIELPEGAELEVDIVSGDIDVAGGGGSLALKSVNGNIVAAGSPDVAVSTVNGSVVVRLPDAATRAELGAVNGRLEVKLPPKLGAKLRASTLNGNIESDFPLSRRDEVVGSRATAKLGDGRADVALETVNGRIKISKA